MTTTQAENFSRDIAQHLLRTRKRLERIKDRPQHGHFTVHYPCTTDLYVNRMKFFQREGFIKIINKINETSWTYEIGLRTKWIQYLYPEDRQFIRYVQTILKLPYC